MLSLILTSTQRPPYPSSISVTSTAPPIDESRIAALILSVDVTPVSVICVLLIQNESPALTLYIECDDAIPAGPLAPGLIHLLSAQNLTFLPIQYSSIGIDNAPCDAPTIRGPYIPVLFFFNSEIVITRGLGF